ncbi:hypothetical protein MTO96_021384 [Rhipicephalus appendiculatus]
MAPVATTQRAREPPHDERRAPLANWRRFLADDSVGLRRRCFLRSARSDPVHRRRPHAATSCVTERTLSDGTLPAPAGAGVNVNSWLRERVRGSGFWAARWR